MIDYDIKCKVQIILCVILLSMFCTGCTTTKDQRNPRIAIIGGGIGGTVTAYEISKLAAKNGYDISLDLYEAAEIGGRLATTKVNGHEFETGGSIIHVDNKHMTDYVESNGLHWYKEPPGYVSEGATGFYDGKEFVFITSNSKIWNAIRLMWRYGLDLLTFESQLVKPMMSHFERIYSAQEKEMNFADAHSLLAYMSKDFPDLMKVELKEYLLSQGYSERFIDEIVFIATNVNYNQNTDIPVFVGSVSLAGAQDGSLRSVEGGNKQVPQTLLAQSDAKLIKAKVESITRRPDSNLALAVGNQTHVYDYVVIACPIMENSKDKIQFVGFPDLDIPVIEYQKTVTTLVHGELNYTFFNFESSKGLPNSIFSINNKLFYNSISVLSPVTFDSEYDNKVFKVFSKDILTDEQLNLLFRTRDSVTVIPWLAYPLFDTNDRNLSFVLDNNLFYVNAIEWVASAMEMSAISGVNIALRLHQRLKN